MINSQVYIHLDIAVNNFYVIFLFCVLVMVNEPYDGVS
jgi:hypothetical protein